MIEAYLDVLEMDMFEVTEAFRGLADENVWKRPAEGLLSIGELAGHIAHWEAVRLAGDSDDPADCRVKSPLIDRRFRYYPGTIGAAPSEQHLAMTAQQVCDELLRVHKEAVADLKARNPAPDSFWAGHQAGLTYAESLKYTTFHVAYHTGQMYSVRHLLGEQTPDN